MSGQSGDKQIKSAFELMMRLIDRMFEYDAPLPEGLPGDFIEKYEKLGALDWHELYEEGVGLNFINELGPNLGLAKLSNDPSAEEVAKIGDQIESLDKNFKPARPRKIKDSALSDGVRWMITIRVLKSNLTSCVRFGLPVSELIVRAKHGEKAALLKLAKLDSTFLTTDYARKILRAVELSQDSEFKRKLSKAVLPEKDFWTLRHPKKKLRDALALFVLSSLGYESRPYPDWVDFMEEQPFKNLRNEQNISFYVKTYGIPKKRPKRRKNLER